MPPVRHAARWSAVLAVAAAAVVPVALAAPAQAAGDPLAGRTVVGRLVQAWPEAADARAAEAAEPLTWVQPATGEPVRVPTGDVDGLPAGATVQVTVGAAVADPAPAGGDVGVAHSVVSGRVLSDADAAGTPDDGPVTDQVTVVAAAPTADTATLDRLTAAVTGPVHDFWSGQTAGRVRFGVAADSATWVPGAALDCEHPTTIWAAAATAVGFTPGPGKHLLVHLSDALPGVSGCAYGLAEVGDGIGSGGDLYVRDTLPTLIAHELGHNLGLGHSSGEQCDGAVDSGACRVQPYRDYYDVMGASWEHAGTLDAAQQARLGVLPAASRQVLDAAGAGGTVTLAPLGGRTGTRALELTSGSTAYWLEYRAATGQDAWLTGNRLGLQTGVLLHRAGDLPDTSLLLDGTPSRTAGWDADLQEALPVGRPVALAGGVTVTVTAVTAGAATLAVTTTDAAPAPASPAPLSRPTTLPSGGTAAHRPPTAGPAATAAPAAVASAVPQPVAAPAPAVHAEVPVRTRPAALVTSRTPPLAVAGCAVGGCAVLGGLLVAVRRRSRRG